MTHASLQFTVQFFQITMAKEIKRLNGQVDIPTGAD